MRDKKGDRTVFRRSANELPLREQGKRKRRIRRNLTDGFRSGGLVTCKKPEEVRELAVWQRARV